MDSVVYSIGRREDFLFISWDILQRADEPVVIDHIVQIFVDVFDESLQILSV